MKNRKFKIFSILIVGLGLCMFSFRTFNKAATNTTDFINFDVDTVYVGDTNSNILDVIQTDSSLILTSSKGESAIFSLVIPADIQTGNYQLDTANNIEYLIYMDDVNEEYGKSTIGEITIISHNTVQDHITGSFNGIIHFKNSTKTRSVSNGSFDIHY